MKRSSLSNVAFVGHGFQRINVLARGAHLESDAVRFTMKTDELLLLIL